MKKTYIAPTLAVDEAEMVDGLLTAMSIQVSDEGGNEEFVKELDDDDWDTDWLGICQLTYKAREASPVRWCFPFRLCPSQHVAFVNLTTN